MKSEKHFNSNRHRSFHSIIHGAFLSVLIITAALFLTSCGSTIAKNTVFSADDLPGKTIGVQLGTTGDFIASDIEGTTVNTYNKGVDAVNDLINGRVDCVIIDKNPALVFESKFQDDGSKLTAVDGAQFEFEPEYYAIAVPKGDTALVDAINKAIEELKADGTFDELVKTYIEE